MLNKQIMLPSVFEGYSHESLRTKVLEDGTLELYIFNYLHDFELKVADIKGYYVEDYNERIYEVNSSLLDGNIFFEEVGAWLDKPIEERTLEEDIEVVLRGFVVDIEETINDYIYYKEAIEKSFSKQ